MTKNIDVLAPGEESSWTFYVAGRAMTISEEVDDILEVTKKVLDVTMGFFIPKKINYSMLTFSENYPVNDVFEHRPLCVQEEDIESKEEVSFNDLKGNVRNFLIYNNKVKAIRQITIDGKTKFILKKGEAYIDCTSPLDWYSNFDYEGNKLENEFRRDPLWISIFHDYLKGEDEPVGNSNLAHYRIIFWAETDIWFEKTDIGKANRDNFRGMVKKLYGSFNVTGTFFMSDWFSKEDMRNVAFGKD